MHPFRPPSFVHLRISEPGGEDPRPHPRHAHPPSVVAAVRHLVETTVLPYRTIAERTKVNSGTISRWVEKHGWQRPPGASRGAPRPDRRYVPNLIGRALATRLRVQAERLLHAIERSPEVDPAALAEALRLLAQAREEQKIRRGRRLQPPPPRPEEPADTPKPRRKPHDRKAAAERGWSKRMWLRPGYWEWLKERGVGLRVFCTVQSAQPSIV